ncbi:MAG: Crp/Fnr family transcriptional regulator [Candidatus Riflebacteria bacterium]|nr:Crp/Fnr family transcriptional regulator [Candidatus Riflebacteria bacterium]
MHKALLESFSKSDLLREMQPEFLTALASIAVERRLPAGQTLFMQHQDATGFYLINSGNVRIYRIGSDGREQVIHQFGEGEIVGEVPVFEGTAYPACATANTDCEIIYFGRDRFIALGRQQPEIFLNMLGILSRRLRQFVELIDDLSLKDVSARLAKYLMRNCTDKTKKVVELTQSKGALASKLGTIPATLSRTFKKFQELGVIKVSSNKIEILDCEMLESIVHGEKPEALQA